MITAERRLAHRTSLLQPTAVNSILKDVRKLQAEGKQLISLMRGEPDFRTPEHIAEAAAQALVKGRTGYPDNRGEPELRRAVAEKLRRENGLAYDPDHEILITTGATFGIYAALMALLDSGDEVLLPDPVYDAYQSPIRLAGAVVKPVQAKIIDGRFCLTRKAVEAAWTPRARLFLLNTPWNPVGTVLSEQELREIGEFLREVNLPLVSDEIYEAITYDGARHISPAALSDDLRQRCILVNSFSKTYAMTGWRIGYCAAPREIISAMYLVLQQSSRGPATFIQDAAAVALNDSQDCVNKMRDEYTRRRLLVLQELSGIPNVRVLPPEGGFFAMVDARGLELPSAEIQKRLLYDHGVVVVHGSAYGSGGEGTLRVSFASGGENLARGLERLRSALTQL